MQTHSRAGTSATPANAIDPPSPMPERAGTASRPEDRSAQACLLWLLVSTDLGFMALHVINAYTPLLDNWLYSIEADRGYAELFQYIKLFWVTFILGRLALLRRSSVCLSWMLLFGYLLMDDVASLHERGGSYLASALPLTAAGGLRAVDFGELLVTAAAGTVLLGLVVAATARSAGPQQQASMRLATMVALLAIFGVGVDTAHSAVAEASVWHGLLGLVEDGGEMVIASLVLCTAFDLLRELPSPAPSRRSGRHGRFARRLGPPMASPARSLLPLRLHRQS